MAWLVAIIGSLTGFLFGYDEGIIAGSLELVTQHFQLSHLDIGVMASALPLGALFGSLIIGAWLGSRFIRHYGRKTLLAMAGSLFFAGAMGAALAWSISILILSRFVLGLAIGFASVVTPLYLAECAPERLRGAMVAVYQLAITLGILASYSMNYLLLSQKAWQVMFASSAIPALLLLAGLVFLPESPRWLMSVRKPLQARKVLKRLRGSDYDEDELTHIAATIGNEPKNARWYELFKAPYLPVVALGMLLFCFQQLSGINVIIYFAPQIFKNLGYSDSSGQLLATLGIGLLNVLVTLLAIYYVDRIGRKRLLLFGFLGACISLSLISIFSGLHLNYLAQMSLMCLCAYIFCFAVSIGPVPHIAMSEIFPLHLRGAGMGLSSMSNWLFNTLTIFSFPLLEHGIGLEKTFALYAIICGIGYVYTWFFMPETQQLSLETIEDELMQGKALRDIGKMKEEKSGEMVYFS